MTQEEYNKFRREDKVLLMQGHQIYRNEKGLPYPYCPCCVYMFGKTVLSRANKQKEFRKLTNEGIEFA